MSANAQIDKANANSATIECKNTGRENVNNGLQPAQICAITTETKRNAPDAERADLGYRRSGNGTTRALHGRESPRSHSAQDTSRPRSAVHDADAPEHALVTCPECGALREEGIDCREVVDCPGETDKEILAVYQPAHGGRPYDLGNPFDRTNLAIRIQRCIDSRGDFLQLNEILYRRRCKSAADYLRDKDETLHRLRQHQRALNRLKKMGEC